MRKTGHLWPLDSSIGLAIFASPTKIEQITIKKFEIQQPTIEEQRF